MSSFHPAAVGKTRESWLTAVIYTELKQAICHDDLPRVVSALPGVDNGASETGASTAATLCASTAATLCTTYDKNGCTLLHWAGGSKDSSILRYLLRQYPTIDPDVKAIKQSVGRTPLHYAARNGSLSCARLLCDEACANPDALCKGGVTPFQLAVWKNNLPVVEYLVGEMSVDPCQRNDYDCGAVHWLGLACGAEADVLQLANYLKSVGCDFTNRNVQAQGHNSLHKAAWGGQNSSYLVWLRDKCGVWDNEVDSAGNFAADLAEMNGHKETAAILREEFSDERKRSCDILGVDIGADEKAIRNAYLRLAKIFHPDSRSQDCNRNYSGDDGSGNSNGSGNDDTDIDELSHASKFDAVKKAFDHLILEGGRGTQRNRKHRAVELIAAGPGSSSGTTSTTGGEETNDDVDLFKTKLLTVLSDFGDKGFPIR